MLFATLLIVAKKLEQPIGQLDGSIEKMYVNIIQAQKETNASLLFATKVELELLCLER